MGECSVYVRTLSDIPVERNVTNFEKHPLFTNCLLLWLSPFSCDRYLYGSVLIIVGKSIMLVSCNHYHTNETLHYPLHFNRGQLCPHLK